MIRDPELRKLVRSDCDEFDTAYDKYLLKACLVLAGSITEGLLLNYLEIIGYCPSKGLTTREMSLGAMLKACVDAGDLSTDAEKLCGVLKEYRDLVHPGRVLRERLKPDYSQRDVAKQAVERVVSDMVHAAWRRREWAAESIFHDALGSQMGGVPSERVVRLGINRLSEEQLDRLVVEVIPQQMHETSGESARGNDFDCETLLACRVCLEAAWPRASHETRVAAAAALAKSIEWGAALEEAGTSDGLISDVLEYLEPAVRNLVLDETVANMASQLDRGARPNIKGLAQYLRSKDVQRFVTPLARGALTDKGPGGEQLAGWAKKALLEEVSAMSTENRHAAIEVMDRLVEKAQRSDAPRAAERLAAMRYAIEPVDDADIPR
jgi:hypothetical protein